MKQEELIEKLITEVKCARNGESFYDGARFICNLINAAILILIFIVCIMN